MSAHDGSQQPPVLRVCHPPAVVDAAHNVQQSLPHRAAAAFVRNAATKQAVLTDVADKRTYVGQGAGEVAVRELIRHIPAWGTKPAPLTQQAVKQRRRKHQLTPLLAPAAAVAA